MNSEPHNSAAMSWDSAPQGLGLDRCNRLPFWSVLNQFYATTVSWACRGFCRGGKALKIGVWGTSTTPRRFFPQTTLCAGARARTHGFCVSWRRGVVALSYLIEKKRKKDSKSHDKATTLDVVASWPSAKSLKNLEKGQI